MSARNDYRIMRGPDVAEGYECLVAPDGSDVTTLTEPEDRTFYRDLLPVLALLNKQHEALSALRAERDEAVALLKKAVNVLAYYSTYRPLVADIKTFIERSAP